MHELRNRRLRSDDESGAIVVVISILVSTLLIISLFVMVFDISAIYSERRVQQNSSDSAVLATAQECAVNGSGAILNLNSAYPSQICGTQTYAMDFANKYANLNSPDNLSKVTEVCGSTPLQNCNSLNNGQFECKTVDSKYKNFVRVKSETLQSNGSFINSLFTSLTDPNSARVKVVSCSQSAWGKAGFAPIIFPIAMPICDYAINGTKLIQEIGRAHV